MKKEKMINLEDLIQNLEELHTILHYKNRKYCQKYLRQLIVELKTNKSGFDATK